MKLIIGLFLVLAAVSCKPEKTICGEGTSLVDNYCLPDIEECRPGTMEVDGECVSVCGLNEYWDPAGEECRKVPECGDGTFFDPENGHCAVVEDVCGPGTSLVEGQCVPDITECGPGTDLVDGQCVSDVDECGPGAVLEDGLCVPESLPDPDIEEHPDPDGIATFDLPDPGGVVTLGGFVDSPFIEHPENADYSVAVADWDLFSFHASGGTWLRLSADSDGAAMPAFIIQSVAQNQEGYPLFVRYGMEPGAPPCSREVYLPFTDDYIIWVSDLTNFVNAVFGIPLFPVGGEEFTYLVSVENLGEPSPVLVDSLPFEAAGDFTNGELAFFELPADLTPDVHFLTGIGKPVEEELSAVRHILMLFEGGDRLYFDQPASYVDSDLNIVTPAANGESYLVVKDFDFVVGPQRSWALTFDEIIASDCRSEVCDGLLEADAFQLLRWDLEAGELLAATIGMHKEDEGTFGMVQTNRELQPMAVAGDVSANMKGVVTHYADEDLRIYALLYGNTSDESLNYQVESVFSLVPDLTVDEPTDLVIVEYPDGSIPDSGIARLFAQVGQVVTTSIQNLDEAPWEEPRERLLTEDLEVLAPAFDALADDVRESFAERFYAWVREDGSYLHSLSDEAGDVAGSTYEVSFHLQEPVEIGRVETTPVLLTDNFVHEESRMAFFTFSAEEGSTVEVEVLSGAGFWSRVSVAALGKNGWAYGGYRWIPDESESRLAEIGRATADAAGETVGVQVLVPYDGELMIIVEDISEDLVDNLPFSLNIGGLIGSENDSCDSAQIVDPGLAGILITGDTTGARNQIDLGWNNPVTGGNTAGPDLFYALHLDPDQVLTAELTAHSFEGVLYLINDCGPPVNVVAGSSFDEDDESLVLVYASEQGGDYVLAVDGHFPEDFGPFELALVIEDP